MDIIEHLYSQGQLNWFIEAYNNIFNYFKLSWEFWVDDKIIDLKRGLIFQNSETFFWDYLDAVHKPAKKIIWKEWVHCIKFILDSWKEVIIALWCKPEDKLPNWIYKLEDFIWILTKNQLYKYVNYVNQTLWKIKENECNYFNSMEYKKKAQKADMLAILNSWN